MESKQPGKKFSLFHKLIASYAAISLFTLTALVVSFTGLYSLNLIARDIVAHDFVLINSVDSLRESILAQQSYAAKFVILKGPEFQELYLQREAEFLATLQKLHKISNDQSLNEIALAYQDFRATSRQLFQGVPIGTQALKSTAEGVTSAIKKTLDGRQKLLNEKLESAAQRERSTVRWTLLLSLTGFLLAVCVAALLIYNIATAVRKLKRATHRIAEGDFDFDPGIPRGDEVGELADDFTRMARRLKDLEQISLDASPLTRLPGNIAIEQVLKRKLSEGSPFAVCYADLDNFKAYNDRYGYIQASELIKKTGEIIYETIASVKNRDDFVGHIGGDDFMMVVSPEQAVEHCEAIIKEFSRVIPEFYSPEDRDKGAIEGVDRYGVRRRFPIMTISIAIVICQQGTYDSAVSIGRAAAEMKDNLKVKDGSNYSINRRILPR
jgi:diguanylate cyclase (GGDEF)-like protein